MLIFLYGSDDFRARQKITELREKFIKEIDPGASSISALDASRATLDDLSSLYRSGSLFTKRRFVVLEKVLDNKNKDFIEELTSFIEGEKKNENILVVYEPKFVEKKIAGKNLIMKPGADDKTVPLSKIEKKMFDVLSKGDFVQSFFPASGANLLKTLAGIAKQHGATLSVPAAQLLIRLIGTDLWPLSRELAKLAAYAAATGKDGAVTISEADVRLLVSQSVTDSIFALTDALGNKQSASAIQLLEEQLNSGSNANYLLTMMLWQFKILASVRQGLDEGHSPKELAKALALHPYVLEKSINQVRKFSFPHLERAINKLVEADYKSKTGQGTLEELLPVVIAGL